MKKMKLKNKDKKKNKIKLFKFRYIVYLGIVYFSFSFSYYLSMKLNNVISTEEFLDMLLSDGDISDLYETGPTKIVSKTMNMLFSIDISRPSTILNSTILKYGTSNDNSTKDKVKDDEEDISIEEVEEVSDYIEDPNPSKINNPIVYLYNSHQLENYSSEYLEIYGIKPNVQMASYILKEKLNDIGISTIVEESDITGILKNKKWAYYKSYDVTRELINNKIKEHSSLKYFIDLHRDSVPKSVTTIDINGKYYAKILFVLGLEYDSYEENLKLMEQINNLVEEKYPGLSRGILKKEGNSVNGIYNQDINNNVILIEVGSVDNTIEEVYNTVTALSEVLKIVVGGGSN